ncbi:4-hydroxy-3-methylbut-2-enyl diphosphate reductase [Sphingomonas sp. Sphisp140]|uniref:4-hydroxy-3-methylbut-2-enyl diphosphate reductase n=1 Tax=unclassified Sphingomonas TaxID=196159 RepID=UPI0039AFC290
MPHDSAAPRPETEGGKILLLANPRGFCAGVERAIAAVEDALTLHGAPVYVRRHIVHNQHVVDRLMARGAIFVSELAEIPAGAVTILSAHGVPQAVLREARERGLRTLDTTCPLVAKVHAHVLDEYHAGRHVLLIGHQGHPEIIGTLGQVPPGAISVVGSPADVSGLGLADNIAVGYAIQTTFAAHEAATIIAAIKARFRDVSVPRASDICYATSNRQEAIQALAAKAGHVIVVGDPLSSNARRLVEVSLAAGCPDAQLVPDAQSLDSGRLAGVDIVALTAAASAPGEAIGAVVDRLETLGYVAQETGGKIEAASFRPVPMTPMDEISLDARSEAVRRDVERCLERVLVPVSPGAQPRLCDAMRYAVLGGGKRLRGLLTVLVAEMLGAEYRHAIWIAAAIECLHAQSLVHDDLPCMDNDDFRRGKPSLHRAYDEATAVLAGDALLALAFEMLADERAHSDPAIRAGLVSALARTIGKDGLALGQMMDLYPDIDAPAAEIERCEQLKTGNLLGFCVEGATLIAGCDGADRDRLLRFSQKLGLAFQIRDDILDRVGSAAEMGKRVGKDRAAGRRTAIEILGLEGARHRSASLAQACLEDLEQFGARADRLREITGFAISRTH